MEVGGYNWGLEVWWLVWGVSVGRNKRGDEMSGHEVGGREGEGREGGMVIRWEYIAGRLEGEMQNWEWMEEQGW